MSTGLPIFKSTIGLLLLAALASAASGANDGVSLAPAAKIDPWLSNRLAIQGSARFLVLFDGLGAGPHARATNYLEAIGHDSDGVRVRYTMTGVELSIAA